MKRKLKTAYGKYGFYLAGDMLDALRAEAADSGISISEVVRKYVDAGLPHVRALPTVQLESEAAE